MLTERLTKNLKTRAAAITVTHPDLKPRSTIFPRSAREGLGKRRTPSQEAQLCDELKGSLDPTVEVGETLGQGGMGVVYRGTQRSLDREVAVKTLREQSDDPKATLKLLSEAWVTGSLEHPNVLPVYDLRLDQQDRPQVLLKRVEGVEWAEIIHDADAVRRRSGEELLEYNLKLLMQLCYVVSFAHSRGIIHRDLKPENVMIGEFGEVYLYDWGIAVSLEDDHDGRIPCAADAREIAGTPCYMAPEMLGEVGVPLSKRTDVYLLGAILYDIISGKPPHLGTNMSSLLIRVAENKPSLPSSPEGLVAIVRRALATDPEDRFESVDAFRQQLQQFLKHRSSTRLCREAEQRTDKLREMLATKPAEGARDNQLYKLFGECRCGFQEALRSWPENAEAQKGLVEVTSSLVEHELSQGEPHAAYALLAELDKPPEELRQRVDEALRQRRQQQERIASLERLEKQHDPRIGRRTRLLIMATLGLFWTASPLLRLLSGELDEPSHWSNIIRAAIFVTVTGGLWVWGRKAIMATAFNRRVLSTAMLAMIVYLVIGSGSLILGTSPLNSFVFTLAAYAAIAGMATITIERGFLLAALGYFGAFFAAVRWPESRVYVAFIANLVTTITVIVLWRKKLKNRR